MAATAEEKTCRMTLKLTRSQRSVYEQAATLTGQTLSQWSTDKLDEAARQDTGAATSTALSDEAFREFCALLDTPVPNEAAELLRRSEIWS